MKLRLKSKTLFASFTFFFKYAKLVVVILMNERIKRIVRLFLAADCVILLIYASVNYCIPFLNSLVHPVRYIKTDEEVLHVTSLSIDQGEASEHPVALVRGTKVQLLDTSGEQAEVEFNGEKLTVPASHLAKTLEECVDTPYVYPRRLINLFDEKDGKLTTESASKGEQLEVVNVSTNDLDPTTGIVKWYEITKNDKRYWVPGAWVETNEKRALRNYGTNVSYTTDWNEYYGKDHSKDAYIDQIDYKPMIKPAYDDNVMPETVNAYHVSMENFISNQQELLALKDHTSINALVVEFKTDDGIVCYESSVPEKYLKDPSAAISPQITIEQLEKDFERFEKAGYYMIARISVFRDPVFASQNPKEAYSNADGSPAIVNGVAWPSPFSRKAWLYNVDLALEIAPFVNEVQFDYIRFSEYSTKMSGDLGLDFHNTYDESRAAAIQGFLMYAHTKLEEQHVYVGANLFAWPVVMRDDQDIGQFLPAMANAADVISPMPYLDHFQYTGQTPQETIYSFSSLVRTQLDALEEPAKYRTWIQGYSLDPDSVRQEIEGIHQAGYDGYMVWAGNGDMEILRYIEPGLQ